MCIELPPTGICMVQEDFILYGMGVSESHSGGGACDRIVEVFLTPGCFVFFNSQQRDVSNVFASTQKENFLLLHGSRDRTDTHSIFYLEIS